MSAMPLPLPEPERTPIAPRTPSPDYLPARMVNEFVYCPRLFFYEWVEGVFRESADTLEGSAQHKRVDARPTELPEAGTGEEKRHARSVTLSSERLKVIAKLDLVEAEGTAATPVDYKHGAPHEGKDGIEMWPADRVQIALQAIVLRENGYDCAEAVVYYQKTRQRVRVPVDSGLISGETEKLGGGLPQRTHRTNQDGSPRSELENRIVRKCMAELGISCEVMAGAGRPMASTTGQSGFGEK